MDLSGSLAVEIGQLPYMETFNAMWNNLSGPIPKEIGNAKSLKFLVLNGNELSGSLPEEMGNLQNLFVLQIDENKISGTIPKSFGNLKSIGHLHMNNNSLSGEIPEEISYLPSLVHIVLDNNNLTGPLPAELSNLANLLVLQLDNNKFTSSHIPSSYSKMSKLVILRLRNCGLEGEVPDLSGLSLLDYLDLSHNGLSGPIPTGRLSESITTIDLANNNLNGSIPAIFSGLPHLQRLSLARNQLSGSVPSTIWQNMLFSKTATLILDFQDNRLSNISDTLNPPENVTIRLQGNPLCTTSSQFVMSEFCGPERGNEERVNSTPIDFSSSCPTDNFCDYVPNAPHWCFCAVPIRVDYRLRSPGFSSFLPYKSSFEECFTQGLNLEIYQLDIDSISWEEGHRLWMHLKIFPQCCSQHIFNSSEIQRIKALLTGWKVLLPNVFGSYDVLNFSHKGPFDTATDESSNSGITIGALVGIVLGVVAVSLAFSGTIFLFVTKRHTQRRHGSLRTRPSSSIPIKIDGVKGFTFGEMARATDNFINSSQVGQGGYGKVYRGCLADGTVVAIKRAEEGSLQGQREFLTEIELLSRLHHRNLVSLVGYCDGAGEQMLVYEFMPNGTLRDHLYGKSKEPLSFAMRLRIALGSARGILYLHNDANPAIFHRDIKASNILLDSKFVAKVADFGLSRLAPLPDLEGTIPDHVSTVVKGTPGYLDPEYFLTHQLTDKSDVYSLGVVFLELLTGMHPISQGRNIVREVNNAYRSGLLLSIIDGQMDSCPLECIEQFTKLALQCCLDHTDGRPTMTVVVRELESIWQNMPESESLASRSIDLYSASSSTKTRNVFTSYDISGSDLVSGNIPPVYPR
ncbi:probable LRR receptor-like serine/threonine-protein kinase At1g06840 isoform X1 [Amborella trichopoda]|uniref:probable LRR receptor-like serine/threonine-protein kinase At1g06840 isoform X1 n=3 Tax=Amborella trichopoda TaxID=13333 RepID=UPI0009C09208|nr:probable LRR receptor-like serine/threonine-protein kinase At1g06840 isoform X1 [Amborella trichopoda]|eukprot:XP_020521708.1 probable LRR receptor-like serine/threonine-protein kinase At1g06840 isoform X1 [Amborella trichopoda]